MQEVGLKLDLAGFAGVAELEMKLATGWTFVSSRITKEFTWERYVAALPAGTIPILRINP